MKLSARNQLKGTVENVTEGAVNGHVTLELADGARLTSSVTNEAIDELALAEGSPAVAIVKATDVMLAV